MYNSDRKGPPRRFRIFFPIIALLFAFALGAIVMLLWNAVLVPVLRVRNLSYWQGVGLLVLCRILFGRFGKPSGPPPMMRRGPWRQKWMQMSAEEKAKFREEWKRRCGPWRSKGNESQEQGDNKQ